MKKIIVLFVALYVATLGAAQTVIGLRLGGNVSDFKLSDDLYQRWNVDAKIAPTVGLFADIPLFGTSFSLQPEALWVQRKSFWESQDEYPRYYFDRNNNNVFDKDIDQRIRSQQTTKMNYVDVPILLKYKFRGRSSQFYLNAGVRFGVGISAAANRNYLYQGGKDSDGKPRDGNAIDEIDTQIMFDKYQIQANTATNKLEFGKATSDEYNKNDFGFVAGVGYTFEVEDVGYFSIDARINTSSNTIFNATKNYVTDPQNAMIKPSAQSWAKHQTWMFSLSYAYPLGGF
jgi:hypothetical protein